MVIHVSIVNIARARPRLERVARLRRQGLTYAQIGDAEGVSRQRAAQLVARAIKVGLLPA